MKGIVLVLACLLLASSTVSADSLNCRLVGTYNVPVGYPIDVAVVDSLAYITAAHGGLRIVSLTDPQNPTEVGFSTAMANALGVDLKDSIAYVAGHAAGVFLINVADPHNPTLAGQGSTPAVAGRVAAKDTFLYVADRDAGLRVLSVADPANPHEVGFCDTLAFYEDVVVADTVACVSAALQNLFLTINVANPAGPSLAGYCALPNGGQGLTVSGNYAYVTAGDVLIVDVSNPVNPQEVGRYVSPNFAMDVRVAGDFAYVADGNAGLRVVDVSNPLQPQEVGYYDTPGFANGVDLAGDYICVTEDPVGLRVFQFYGAGVAETPSAEARMPNGGPTIVSGVLRLPLSQFTLHSSLFSLSGQKVMALRPGPNDVSRLAPGVYFVHAARDRAVRKVLVTK